MKKQWLLLASVCLIAVGAIAACGLTGGGSGSSAADDDAATDDDSGGDVNTACQDFFTQCATALHLSGTSADFCNTYLDQAAGGECYIAALLKFFQCAGPNCDLITCGVTLGTDELACGGH